MTDKTPTDSETGVFRWTHRGGTHEYQLFSIRHERKPTWGTVNLLALPGHVFAFFDEEGPLSDEDAALFFGTPFFNRCWAYAKASAETLAAAPAVVPMTPAPTPPPAAPVAVEREEAAECRKFAELCRDMADNYERNARDGFEDAAFSARWAPRRRLYARAADHYADHLDREAARLARHDEPAADGRGGEVGDG